MQLHATLVVPEIWASSAIDEPALFRQRTQPLTSVALPDACTPAPSELVLVTFSENVQPRMVAELDAR